MIHFKFLKTALKKLFIIQHLLSVKERYLAGKKLLNDIFYKECQNKTKIEIEKSPTRTDVINYLLSNIKDSAKYLEIGIRNPNDNYNKIIAKEKYSVDPGVEFHENPADFKITSDSFFNLLSQKKILKDLDGFDVIFIDGLHTAEQVDRDIENSFKWLKDSGFIILHDCNPPSEWHAREEFLFFSTPAGGYWNGTTWKAFLKWRSKLPLHSCCVDSDWGIGILNKKHKIGFPFENNNEFYEFKYLNLNRRSSLNLISFDELKIQINDQLSTN